jgi:hypothetical protein
MNLANNPDNNYNNAVMILVCTIIIIKSYKGTHASSPLNATDKLPLVCSFMLLADGDTRYRYYASWRERNKQSFSVQHALDTSEKKSFSLCFEFTVTICSLMKLLPSVLIFM